KKNSPHLSKVISFRVTEFNIMEKDFLKEFIIEIANENEKKIAQEKKKKYFQELGKKGGLKKKNSPHLSKVISFRVTEFNIMEKDFLKEFIIEI
ncbi:hypothetical protein BOQ60_25115, partial [Chryseobacterium sp. CH1]